ncbi:phosphotransferase family protein [Rhabdothermincola sp.]|uniref:phosphotransferase family protein n=1 Tax=Rhabdothermincola sp. TaxID=2820405 RepID=UPI002FE2530F
MGTQRTPWLASSAEELLAGATQRTPLDPSDGKSGSRFERVVIGGQPYFVKSLSYERDWIMRVTGDRDHRPLLVWRHGIMAAAPACIDHTVVGMAIDSEGEACELTVLMHDVGPWLVPEGDGPVALAQHLGFLDHLAELSATFWGWQDHIGLTPLEHRFRFFAPDNIAPELARPEVPVPLRIAAQGWEQLPRRAPELHELVRAIHDDTGPLAAALRQTPSTFLHGDWKMGNLGTHPDGRTILLDWAYPGSGPACYDLAWYLALNRARLPQPKEDAISVFQDALERQGIETAGWFDAQLELSLLAIMATFAWEKAVGEEAELRWWEAAARRGARWLR